MTESNSSKSADGVKQPPSVFVALGAGGGNPRGQSLHRGRTHGSLSMNAYLFGGEGAD